MITLKKKKERCWWLGTWHFRKMGFEIGTETVCPETRLTKVMNDDMLYKFRGHDT